MSLILSIDIGTSNMKAAIVDSSGNILSHNTSPLEIYRPEHRAAQHNPVELHKTLLSLCKKTLKNYNKRVTHISLSAYQFGLILLDTEKRPLTGITTLRDTRARLSFEKFKESFQLKELYQKTGCPPFIQYPLARLFYWKENAPELLDQTAWVLSAKAYFMYMLTGEMFSDPSTESASQFLNLHDTSWNSEVLEKVGITTEQLPKIADSYKDSFDIKPEIISDLGLNNNVKIIPGLYDGAALAVGIGYSDSDTGIINMGTSGMFRVPSTNPILDKTQEMRLQTYHFLDNTFLTGGAINNASLTLSWLRKQVLDVEYEELLKLAKDSPRCAKKLFFLPYLTGERDWNIGNYASGVLFGLRDFHSKSDMARSFFEGVCYSFGLLEGALADNEIKVKQIRVGGGGSKFDFWVQMLADVLNCPLLRSTSKESTLLGNAALAYTHNKEFSSVQEAIKNMESPLQEFLPERQAHTEYQEMFEFYKDLYSSLASHYKKHALLGRESSDS